MSLCTTCREIFTDDLEDKWETDKNGDKYRQTSHLLGDQLRESADVGCFICTRVFAEYQRSHRYEWIRAMAELEPPTESRPWYHLWMYHAIEGDPPHETSYISSRIVIEPDDPLAHDLGVAATGTEFTGSEANLSLARHWLSRCFSEHESCTRNTKPTWYPSRLLKICREYVFLIDTRRQSPTGPYATLSHCWGREPFECLTAENKATFEGGLLRSDFLPTFRDAIATVERLGMEYLWIDSCCIIQSTTQTDPTFTADKMAEIASMNKVYANAILNIGAAHGSSPRVGCFVQRRPIVQEARRFLWSPTGERCQTMYCMREHFGTRELANLYSRQGLFKRAWVMQERLLAPRMLHFSDSQLYWECCEIGLASETYPEGMPEHGPKREPTNAWPLFSLEENARDDFDIWDSIVRDYTKLSLTFPAQDTLIALGAVAAQMAEKFQDIYAAGLFQRHLLRSLCWRTFVANEPQVERLINSPAPSWSWASMNCPVGYKSVTADDEPLAIIEQVNVELLDAMNPFGAVQSGKLSLRGRLFEAQLSIERTLADSSTRLPKSRNFMIDIEGISHEDRFLDAFNSIDEFDALQGRTFFLPMFWALDYALRINGREDETMMIEDVLALPEEYRSNAGRKHRVHGLLLIEQPNGSYKRLHMVFNVPAGVMEDRWVSKPDVTLTLI